MRRGALYHHFADKSALLATVCSQIVDEALPVVEAAAAEGRGPRDALVRGSIAWVGFVTQEEIRRILLVDAPTVLGWKRWQALEDRLSVDALRAGIGEAIASEEISFDGDPELLATLSNGALNALALRAGDASPPVASSEWQQAIRAYWDAFANSP